MTGSDCALVKVPRPASLCYALGESAGVGNTMSYSSSFSSSRLVTLSVYPRKMLELLETEWQIPRTQLLLGTRFTAEQLLWPNQWVSLIDTALLFHHAQKLCPAPDLALRYAAKLPPSAHGLLGTATLTAANFGAVIALYYDYLAVVAPMILLHKEQRRDQQVTVFELMADSLVDESFIMIMLVAVAVNIARPILRECLREISFHLMCPAPTYADKLLAHCQGGIHFNASFNGMSVPMALLDAKIISADTQAHAVVVKQLNERMDMLMSRGSFVDSIKQYLRRQEGPLPRMSQAAEAFSMSVRAFRSRLATESASYQRLLDGAREEHARYHLRSGTLSVKEIAYRLGFQESSNFSRVFKRWTGLTPLAYRSQMVAIESHSGESRSDSFSR